MLPDRLILLRYKSHAFTEMLKSVLQTLLFLGEWEASIYLFIGSDNAMIEFAKNLMFC
jgi:hypothetical protein